VANAAVLGKVFLMYTNDASPDSDLDGNVVVTQGINTLILSAPFKRSGTFSYAIVSCWWPNEGSTNVAYYQWTADQVTPDVENTVWRTPPFPIPSGTYYVTVANRNEYGLGTRLVPGGVSTPDDPQQYVSNGCVPIAIVAGAVATNVDLGHVFSISATGDYTLSNPTGTAYCGMTILWMSTGSGIPTLGSKYVLMNGESIDPGTGRNLIAAIYNAVDDEWDTFFKKAGVGVASASTSPSPSSSKSASPSAPSATPSPSSSLSASLSASPSAPSASASPSAPPAEPSQSTSASTSASPSQSTSASISASSSSSASAS